MKLPLFSGTSPVEAGHYNILVVLLALHLFGHVRRSELMYLLWPNQSTESRNVSASRLFTKMERDGLIDRKLNALGSVSYVLSLRGARIAAPYVPEVVSSGAPIRGMQGSTFFHRTLGTAWLIRKLREGLDVYGEYALAANTHSYRQVDLRRKYGKLPDGLVLRPHANTDGSQILLADWLEVESSHKRPLNLDSITKIVWQMGEPLAGYDNTYLDRVCFLYTRDSSHENAIVRAVDARLAVSPVDDVDALLSSVLMVRAVAQAPLVIQGFEEHTLADIARARAQRAS